MSTDQNARFHELLPALTRLINLHFRGGPDPPTVSFHDNQAVVNLMRSISLEQPVPDDTVPEAVVNDAIRALTSEPWTAAEAAEIRARADQAMRDLVTLARDDPTVIDKVVWLVGQVRRRVAEERKVEKELWKMREASLLRRLEEMEISGSHNAPSDSRSRREETVVIWEDTVDQEENLNGGERAAGTDYYAQEDPDGDSDKENRDPRIWRY
ncbi:hypothetical protein B0T22DRAFT_480003 [Podospora appendiculata]|uniref:Uncharacterized protein n=1 Tax=Podospora appendiculata TaxID=314037 RepID=A0AAE0X9X2_9PEZI|nr:hypothetical protein B0T22DRAFT_480003 [Podospora appendiculata]